MVFAVEGAPFLQVGGVEGGEAVAMVGGEVVDEGWIGEGVHEIPPYSMRRWWAWWVE